MEKTVAILQSNYIPWKGYFDIINSVDEFIIFDIAQYTKNDWRNRNKIRVPEGEAWLTIPVFHRLSQKINETKVINNLWRKKHWKNIVQNYSKARYFKHYKGVFEELYLSSGEELLSKINNSFIKAINSMLGIETILSWASDYLVKLTMEKNELLVDLCRQAKATRYLSGPSAKVYLKEYLFNESGIDVLWMDYSGYPEYQQLHSPFIHAVSIIDLIFNEGPNTYKYMKSFEVNEMNLNNLITVE